VVASEVTVHELRAVTLSNYLEVAAATGLDGYWMLRHAGISPAALDDPDNRIPAQAVVRLLERSARRSGCENFALLMAEHRPFASIGPIALLLDRLPTLRDVIKALMTYRRHMNDIIIVDLEEGDDTAIIRVGFLAEYAQVQITDFAIAIGYKLLTGATHGGWQPSAVHLVRGEPEDLVPWRRVFPVPVAFSNLFNGFSCPRTALDIPNPYADAAMARHAERLLQLVPLPEEGAPLSDRARRAIVLMLPNGQAQLEPVAAQLGMSVRALQRGLSLEGVTFAGLLGEVRRDLAQVYLAGTHSITAIAEQLGYASPSAFTRWFAAEFGTPPQAWRNDRRAQSEAPSPTWTV
jgi:AraC-like DNA-binding protein